MLFSAIMPHRAEICSALCSDLTAGCGLGYMSTGRYDTTSFCLLLRKKASSALTEGATTGTAVPVIAEQDSVVTFPLGFASSLAAACHSFLIVHRYVYIAGLTPCDSAK